MVSIFKILLKNIIIYCNLRMSGQWVPIIIYKKIFIVYTISEVSGRNKKFYRHLLNSLTLNTMSPNKVVKLVSILSHDVGQYHNGYKILLYILNCVIINFIIHLLIILPLTLL